MRVKKKPITLEAIQWTGENLSEIKSFMQEIIGDKVQIVVATPEGNMIASKNDWIIRGVKGEYYPCKPDIFAELYEVVEKGIKPQKGSK